MPGRLWPLQLRDSTSTQAPWIQYVSISYYYHTNTVDSVIISVLAVSTINRPAHAIKILFTLFCMVLYNYLCKFFPLVPSFFEDYHLSHDPLGFIGADRNATVAAHSMCVPPSMFNIPLPPPQHYNQVTTYNTYIQIHVPYPPENKPPLFQQ